MARQSRLRALRDATAPGNTRPCVPSVGNSTIWVCTRRWRATADRFVDVLIVAFGREGEDLCLPVNSLLDAEFERSEARKYNRTVTLRLFGR